MQKSLGGQIVIPPQSPSVIPIVAPASDGEPVEQKTTKNKTSPQTSPENLSKLRAQSPAFQAVSSVSADSVNAPEFVPRFTTDTGVTSPTKETNPIDLDLSNNSKQTYQAEASNLASMTSNFSQFSVSNDLQHHLYSGPLSHVSNLLPHQRTIQSFFIPDNLREQLTERNEAQLMTVSARELGLPLEVHVYHSLYPLDSSDTKSTKHYYGHPTSVYKATCSVDGRTYALIRIEGYRLVNELAMTAVETWRRIRHCNIVSIREAFTTRAFGDSSIHGSGLAARNIEPSKILLTGENRLRMNGASILDVLQYDGGLNVARHQQEDLLAFGKLIIALACNSTQSFQDLSQSFDYITRYYSSDLKNLILYLLGKPLPTKSIDEVVVMISPHILQEINSSQLLVRLMSKMGFINERPEFDMDPSWSETGDRYLIKLFRDYVFHQVDENGRPVVDMVHVLTCLNKLDAGVDEKIMLMSRDEQSCLIVSFKEIKNCIISAFNDLTSGRK
ncbi:hypothetical protein INT48_001440 [Thamnidium elegans]|uniref:Pan3 C-terminal knob domain-containing protein n=1 Tax=Thamnidium elegans TaxID=101142 RepID=A0A8H7SMX4_9FUNG|nr:hypothetical protein INT48_001440 [Thamnidium elegans]